MASGRIYPLLRLVNPSPAGSNIAVKVEAGGNRIGVEKQEGRGDG